MDFVSGHKQINKIKLNYPVGPLPTCATVSINVPFNKSLHHNHTQTYRFALALGFQTKVHASSSLK